MTLNPGGWIGALLPLFAGIVGMVLVAKSKSPDAMDWAAQSMIAGLVCGAFLGNFLWTHLVANRKKNQLPDAKPDGAA